MALKTQRSSNWQTWKLDLLSKQGIPRKTKLKPAVARIGKKTKWAYSPSYIAANLRKFELIEEREKELVRMEIDIIRDRQNDRAKEFLSSHRLHSSNPSLAAIQASLLADSIQRRARDLPISPFSHWNSFGTDDIPESDDLDLDSSEDLDLSDSQTCNMVGPSIAQCKKRQIFTRSDWKAFYADEVESTEDIFVDRTDVAETGMTEQYLKLMASVDRAPAQPKKIAARTELFLTSFKEAFEILKKDLSSVSNEILIPEDDFFEGVISVDSSDWISVELKELTTLPDCLINSEKEVEMSESAAMLTMAAWDHYFFTHSNPGRICIPLIGQLDEGETPADKFLFPSQTVRNFTAGSCLWEPLTNKKVLENFMKFVVRGNHMKIPPYLIKCGFMKKVYNFLDSKAKDFEVKKAAAKKKFDIAYGVFAKLEKSWSRTC